jgi:hypothetical protein
MADRASLSEIVRANTSTLVGRRVHAGCTQGRMVLEGEGPAGVLRSTDIRYPSKRPRHVLAHGRLGISKGLP